jgi:hypothetical protein
MPAKSFSPGEPFTGTTLFYDAGSGAAVLVQCAGNAMRERQKHFATPVAALEWCIARRHHFVFMASADTNELNRN